MFLEFGFHAQQTRLNGGFILNAHVGLEVSKNKMIGTIGGVALMKLVPLFCLFVYIRSDSTVAPA